MAVLRPVLVLFGISALTFLIFFATPGIDPAARIAGRGAGPEVVAAVRHEYGLDRPMAVQYALLMKRLFWTRDLESVVNKGQRVVPAILRAAPVTAALAVGAAAIWMVAGLGIGVVGAVSRTGGRVATALGLLGVSIPVFWLGEMVNLLTQDRLREWFAWVPPLGLRGAGWGETALGFVLPCCTLAVLYAGIYGRVLTGSLREAYRQDYVRTARAKGVGETRILLRHALRNALLPVLALFGLDFGALLGGGTLLVEIVFGLRGIGSLTFHALQDLDLPVVMGTVMYGAVLVVGANAAVDAVQLALDPRRR